MKKKLYILIMTFLFILINSCVAMKNSELPQIYTGYTPDFIYARAHQEMQNKQYLKAIKSYKSLIRQYPFTSLTEKGIVELIYVYYMYNELNMALSLVQKFIDMYPYSIYKGYIYYIVGIINFENNRGILQTYTPYNMNYHDPTKYKNAYDNFKKAIQLNPDSNFVPDAKRRMLFIKNTIARYYNDIAHFYFKRGAYNAAINRASQIIQNYPQSTSIEDALILTIKAYNKLELYDQSKVNIQILKKNYPENYFIKDIK